MGRYMMRITVLFLIFQILTSWGAATSFAKAPPGADLVALGYSKGQGLVLLSPYELFLSDDGASWRAAGLMDRGINFTSLAVGNRVILIGTASGRILRSDNGRNFTIIDPPKDPFGRNVAPIRMVAIGPKDREVLASSRQGIVRSSDGGVTWQAVDNPFWSRPEARQILAVGFVKRSAIVVTANGAYVFRQGEFIPFDKGLPDIVRPSVAVAESGRFLVALPEMGIFQTSNGRSWKKLEGTPGDPLAFLGLDGKGFLAARPFSSVFRGDAKGLNWNRVGTFSPDFVPISSVSTPHGVFVILRGKGLVKLSGEGFSPIDLPISLSSVLAELELKSVRLTGTQAGVFISSDMGRTWKDATPLDMGKQVNAFLRLKDDRILMASGGVGVFVSDDSGMSWKEWSRGLGTANTVINLISVGQQVIAATENGLMETESGLDPAWRPLARGIPRRPVYALIQSEEDVWAACASGVYRSTSGKEFKLVKGLEGRATALDVDDGAMLAVVDGKVFYGKSMDGVKQIGNLPERAMPKSVVIFRGELLIGSTRGVFRWNGDGWEPVGALRFPVNRLSVVPEGLRVVTGGAGTYVLP